MLNHPHDTSIFDIVTLAPGNPAAATGYTFGVPALTRVQIIGVTMTITCDANVANRLPYIQASDGTRNFQGTCASALIVANQIAAFFFSVQGSPGQSFFTQSFACAPLADHLYLREGDSLTLDWIGKQAGDTMTGIAIRYKQWITPTT